MDEPLKLTDVGGLDADVSGEQLQAWCSEDDRAFSLLAVAEASLKRVPAGVTQWLSSAAMCSAWEDTLAVQEGNHQLSWWSKMAGLGIEDAETLRTDRRLARIRQRRTEAHSIAAAFAGPPTPEPGVAAAVAALKAAHLEESEWLTDRLRRSSGITAAETPTSKAAELLAMEDDAFRNLVAHDAQGRADADGLAHPAVLARWYGALVELGSAVFAEIGIEVTDPHMQNWFAVPDRHLIQARQNAPVDTWAPKLTFLTHIRAAFIERARLRRQHDQRISAQVDIPLQRHLIDRYPYEYKRYLQAAVAAEPPAMPPDGQATRPPHPASFDDCVAVLHEYGWDVTWIFDGHRVWVDAWKGDDWRKGGRLIATASRARASSGKSAWRWGRPAYVFNSRAHRRYALLTGEDALSSLAETNPRATPLKLLKSVVPQTGDHLEALIPPDGYRWRNPFPPELTELHYR